MLAGSPVTVHVIRGVLGLLAFGAVLHFGSLAPGYSMALAIVRTRAVESVNALDLASPGISGAAFTLPPLMRR
jgi:hypothetical protein